MPEQPPSLPVASDATAFPPVGDVVTDHDDGPPFDPRMDLPGIPDDWRVLWCPRCGYAVTWDVSVTDADDFVDFVWREAVPHDCPAAGGAS